MILNKKQNGLKALYYIPIFLYPPHRDPTLDLMTISDINNDVYYYTKTTQQQGLAKIPKHYYF